MSERHPVWTVVTGAAGALGAGIVQRFLEAGRNVLALDLSSVKLSELGHHERLRSHAVDLADAAAVAQLFDSVIQKPERIGLLVNCAGLIASEPMLTIQGRKLAVHDLGSFQRVIHANLMTAFVASGEAAARMARTGGGSIVNFSSIAAQGHSGQVAYGAAKAAIEGMTKAMAQELGPLGIRVNALAPGFIDVASTRNSVPEQKLEDLRLRTPLRSFGSVDNIYLAISALADNPFANGVILPIDGGLRL